MSPRPGFVLDVDRSTPPTLFWRGERFTLERLPEGSRVIYAPEPIEPLKDPSAAIRAALNDPVGDQEPLPSLLRPDMKLTIDVRGKPRTARVVKKPIYKREG